jgi:hypothetical protein
MYIQICITERKTDCEKMFGLGEGGTALDKYVNQYFPVLHFKQKYKAAMVVGTMCKW